jgi:hypothetical protein
MVYGGGWSSEPDRHRKYSVFEVVMHTEQAPHRDNRVTLDRELDALGARKVQLHWEWRERDIDSARRAEAVLAREIARSKLGRYDISHDERGRPVLVGPGLHHHMGTTRMHVDPKQGVDYFAFEDLPHLEGGIVDRQEEALARIRALVDEMDTRYALMRRARAANVWLYNERVSPAERLPTLWLIHDEFAEWMLIEEYKQGVASAVQRLGVKARAAGIHLVFAAQRPEANVMPMQLRANLGNRLVLRVDSEGTSEIALGDKGAERLLARGHLLAKLEGLPSLVYAQVPYATPDEIDELVRIIQGEQWQNARPL